MSTENMNQPVRSFVPEFSKILSTVFDLQQAFTNLFAPLQSYDGVQNNATAFKVKTNATPVVIGEYDTDKNTAFKTGTAKSSRFGELTEIIYQDTDVPYLYDDTIHEGFDRHTVNNNLTEAIADRLRRQSEAKVRRMNALHGKFLAENAGNQLSYDGDVVALFNEMNKTLVNNEVNASLSAYVTPDLYAEIIDNPLTTTAKASNVNVDSQTTTMFKGFKIYELPESYFPDGQIAIAGADGIGIAFTGIITARTTEAIDFDGVFLQEAHKGGVFILDDNKKALIAVSGGASAAKSSAPKKSKAKNEPDVPNSETPDESDVPNSETDEKN